MKRKKPPDAPAPEFMLTTTTEYLGPTFVLGRRQTFDPADRILDDAETRAYANSLSYRDGWSFFANKTDIGAMHQTVDPVDRRIHVSVSRQLPLPAEPHPSDIEHLALELIVLIELHERLEWFVRNRPDGTVERIFPPHTPTSAPFWTPVETYKHGEQVMAAHAAYMAERGGPDGPVAA